MAAIDTSAWTAYTAGGTMYRVAEYTTPWVEADLPYITYAQQADVVRLACRGVNEYDTRSRQRSAVN